MPTILSFGWILAASAGVLGAIVSTTKGKRRDVNFASLAATICSPKSFGSVMFTSSPLRRTTTLHLPSITILLTISRSSSIVSPLTVSMRSPFWKPLLRAVWQ